MGQYCRICGRVRANERFSGKGHARHIYKECHRLPAEERRRIENLDEICGFLRQSHISIKNLARLKVLGACSDEKVYRLARLVFEIGEAHPYKRRRLQFLARERRDLLNGLEQSDCGP